MRKILASLVLIGAVLTGGQASAQNAFFDEARFALYAAQPKLIEPNHPEVDQYGIGASLIFAPINIDLFGLADDTSSDFVRALFNPRPHVGGMFNFDDDGTSYGFIDLNWKFDITQNIFIEGGLGMAYTNGSKNSTPTRAALGSKWQFHETISLGYQFSESMTILLSAEHLSHREVFSDNNRGLSNLSVKVGYKF